MILRLLGFIFTYIVMIGGEGTKNCDMNDQQPRQPPASNGEAIHDARAEEITPSVAGVRRKITPLLSIVQRGGGEEGRNVRIDAS